MKRLALSLGGIVSLLVISCTGKLECSQSSSDLVFPELAGTWDEAIPLGNATLGELVWQWDSHLRLSLDRTDIWDLRDSYDYSDPRFSYAWVKEQISKGDNDAVMGLMQEFRKVPAPTKLPCAAIEFPLESLGTTQEVRLLVNDALCRVSWDSGTALETFVDASANEGWFRFTDLPDGDFRPELIVPSYSPDVPVTSSGTPSGPLAEDLRILGYEQGKVTEDGDAIRYHQTGHDGFYYDVEVRWERSGSTLTGVWSVSSSLSADDAASNVGDAFGKGIEKAYRQHHAYWDAYWDASSVKVPDPVLQKQYDLEMYKFGSVSRSNSYPISLQAVWTADDGNIPPWQGDFHNDLNTQLSYWPTYIGNHLDEGLSYLNTMWNQRETYRTYTKTFFGTDGITIPGTASLTGMPLPSWPQYGLSPTVGAWMAQHFYLHWKYSADQEFLQQRAYPFMREIAVALEGITELQAQPDGSTIRTLAFSTPPEVHEDSLDAWFRTITNHDLSLIRFTFGAVVEMAQALGDDQDAAHWSGLLAQMPEFDLDEDGALSYAKGTPYAFSHRHLSNAMAIMPLGLINMSDGEASQHIIRTTLDKFDKNGSDWWVGFSFTWLANLKARAWDGDGAAEALRTFADCFCLPNSFNANGDQTKSGISNFTYRPFTLEANFSFASGLQEMLLQSNTGTVRVFPALPSDWKDVSFSSLRAVGAFLVSAEMKDGAVTKVKVHSEKGGHLSIILPGDQAPREFETTAGQDIDILG